MASPARITANLENAAHSTGPRTEAGKKRSRYNALRHGLTGQTVLLPNEDATRYLNFTKSYHDELAPKGVVETQLVQTLGDIQWRINRARAHETAIFAMGAGEIDPAESAADPAHLDTPEDVRIAAHEALVRIGQNAALHSLSLHEHRWQKLYLATLRQFTDLKAARLRQEAAEMQQAVVLFKYHKKENLPFKPENFGFVLTEAEIDHFLWRSGTLRYAESSLQTPARGGRLNL